MKLQPDSAKFPPLRKFKDERNFLSHKGITHCLDYEGEFDEMAASEFEARLLAIEPEAQRLRIAVPDGYCPRLAPGFSTAVIQV